jgi:hypothetical protein
MNQMDTPPPVFGDADARQIVAVLRTFVTIHQRLLNTIIGKHGLLSLFFFTEPVRVALVGLESVVDVRFSLLLTNVLTPTSPDLRTGPYCNDSNASTHCQWPVQLPEYYYQRRHYGLLIKGLLRRLLEPPRSIDFD